MAAATAGSCQSLFLLSLLAVLANSGKPNVMSVLAQSQLLKVQGQVTSGLLGVRLLISVPLSTEKPPNATQICRLCKGPGC